MKTYRICLLPGDGIGPEIIAEGVKVLDAVGEKYGVGFTYEEALIGGIAIDETGEALPAATLAAAKASDAVLLAAVGGPKWDTTDPTRPRPEQGLLGIRKELGLYANLRPVTIFNALADASTLKPEVVDGVDLLIVRELTGGLYFGERERFYDEEGAGEDGGNGLVTFFATLLIVVLWLAIVCVVIKMDVGGFGSSVLAPILKDVPVVNKILPSKSLPSSEGSADGESYGGYESIDEAVAYIRQLELELEREQTASRDKDTQLDELKAEVLRLKEFEEKGDSVGGPAVSINLDPRDLSNTGPPNRHNTTADMRPPMHLQQRNAVSVFIQR